LTKQQSALLEYFRANAWANRQRSKHRDTDAVWQWEQPEQQKQIFHLRRAVLSPGFDKLSPLRQILTNLANQLNTVGRCVEAIATWTRALSINPAFGTPVAKFGVHAHIELMASRPCKPDADLKGLWRMLLGTPFPACGVPADADGGESPMPAKIRKAKIRKTASSRAKWPARPKHKYRCG